jgi:hypothetical protein
MSNIINTLRDEGVLQLYLDLRKKSHDDDYTDHSRNLRTGTEENTDNDVSQTRQYGAIFEECNRIVVADDAALIPQGAEFCYVVFGSDFNHSYSEALETNTYKVSALLNKCSTSINSGIHLLNANVASTNMTAFIANVDAGNKATCTISHGKSNYRYLSVQGTWGAKPHCFIDAVDLGEMDTATKATPPQNTDDLSIGNSKWDYNLNPVAAYGTHSGHTEYAAPNLDGIQAVLVINRELSVTEHRQLNEFLCLTFSSKMKNIMAQGGGKIEWLWHVGGYPYGCTTDAALTEAIEANLDIKRRLFGRASYRTHSTEFEGAHYVWPADNCTCYDVLQQPESQQIEVQEDKGWLSGGGWGVTLEALDHRKGELWRNSAVSGLDGLAVIPDPAIDEDILCGELTTLVTDSESTMTIEDIQGDLHAKIHANHEDNEPTYLWIGQECLCVGDSTRTDTDDEI